MSPSTKQATLGTLTLLLVSGCNVLFGIDSLPPQDAAGSGGGTSGLGAGGGPGGGGAGGGDQGGAGGGGGGGQAGGAAGPPSRLDASFGKGGVITLRPGGVRPLDYRLASVSALPTGKALVVGEMRIDREDYSNVGRPNVFLARLDAAGLDPSFGEAGYAFLNSDPGGSPKRYDDKTRAVSPDAEGGGVYVTVTYVSTNVEDYQNFGTRFWRVGAEGVDKDKYNEPEVATFFASSAGCVAARTYSDAGEDGVEFAACVPPGSWPPLYATRVPLGGLEFLSLADGDDYGDDGTVPPLATTTGHFFLVVSSAAGGEVGALKFRHTSGANAELEGAFGNYLALALAKPDSFDPALKRVVRAATASGDGDLYLAGYTETNGPLVPFLIKFRNDGDGLDLGFGANGVAQGEGVADTAWSCLQIDGGGRLLAAGVRAGQPVLYRFAPGGHPDEAFEPGGRLNLPFAPQRCALDGEGRLLVAGRHGDAFGVPTASVTRIRLDDAARGADAPPDAAPESCTNLDADEPNGEPSGATVMMGARGTAVPIHQTEQAMWKSVLDGSADQDWLRYKVFYDDTYQDDPAPAARVDFAGPVEICLYMSAIEGLRCDPPHVADTATLPGLLGCCDTNATELAYFMPAPPPTIQTDLYIRLSKIQSGPGTCDVYRAVGEF